MTRGGCTVEAFVRPRVSRGRQADMNLHPGTPEELLASLTSVFPQYGYEVEDSPTLTFHALLHDFIVYFGANNSTFTDRQFQKFAEIVNWSVDAGGLLEDAFRTCFLEHLHQVRARKPLVRYLSNAAKDRLHA